MYLHPPRGGEEVPVLKKEDFIVIQALVKRGMFLCDIAPELGVHPKTVRRALERGGPPARHRRSQASLLDPFLPTVDRLLGEGCGTRW
jgi:transposase